MMSFRFEDFEVDEDRFQLFKGGTEVALRPQAMRLLLLLLKANGRLLKKDEIVDCIWDGRAISDSAISSQVKELRKALEDKERPYRIIGTVHGEGFRILASIATGSESPAEARMPDDPPTQPEDMVGSRPSIAVLPFRQIGMNRDYSALCEALPDEIISAIARMRSFRVIARGSSFQFPSLTIDLSTVREKLHVDYCLSGSIELQGDTLAVRVALEDTRDESVVWSERFLIKLAGIHELREEIVQQTVSAIDFHTPLHEMQRTRLVPPEKLTAWQSFHHGMSNVFTFGRPDFSAARDYFLRAVEIDPLFARAHAGLSHVNWWHLIQQNQDIGVPARREMFRAADDAVAADPLDPFANLVRGRAAWLAGDPTEGAYWFERSLGISPSFAMAHGALANLQALQGNADAAMPHVSHAISLSPVDPWLHNFYAIRAAAHVVKQEFEEAVEWAEKAMRLPHDSLIVAQCAVLAMHMGGRKDEARRIAMRLRKVHPNPESIANTGALPIFSPQLKGMVDEAFAASGVR